MPWTTMPDMYFLLGSGCGVDVFGVAALDQRRPAAVVALAQRRGRIAEFLPTGMRQLDPSVVTLRHETDFDQLRQFCREADDPGEGQAIWRLVFEDRSPLGLAP